MNRLNRLITSSMAVLLAAGMMLNFGGCSKESPMSPTVDTDQQADFQILAKKGGRGKGAQSSTQESTSTSSSTSPMEDNTESSTVEQGSKVVRYMENWGGVYRSGHIIIPSGSQFEWAEGSLTPPPELAGKDVTITMTVTHNGNNESVFEFGPSGCQFKPGAKIWFHYAGPHPKLYYINDDGSYVEQQPDGADPKNQWLMLKINHFSRYAVAWAN